MENIIKTKGNKFNFTWIGILLVIYVFILSPLAKHFVLIQSLRNSFVPLALLFLVIFEIIRFYKNKDKARLDALKISTEGITALIGPMSKVGTIRWQDIQMVGVNPSMTDNSLIIKVKNPLDYIHKVNMDFQTKKKLRQYNAKFQTPIIIATDDLNIRPQALRDLIKKQIKF